MLGVGDALLADGVGDAVVGAADGVGEAVVGVAAVGVADGVGVSVAVGVGDVVDQVAVAVGVGVGVGVWVGVPLDRLAVGDGATVRVGDVVGRALVVGRGVVELVAVGRGPQVGGRQVAFGPRYRVGGR